MKKNTCKQMLMSIGIVLFTIGYAMSQTSETIIYDPSFRKFLPRFEEGINQFLNGDAILWKQNASHSGDATIMGAWGAYEKGWE